MPHRIEDRWLWVGFGVFLFFAAHGIRYAIKDLVRLTELEPHPYDTEKQKEELPEDNISLDNLKTLAESPNPNISNAAISLIVSRFLRQPNAYRSVLKDADDLSNENTRIRARQALTFLRNWPLMSEYPDLDYPSHSPTSQSDDSTSSLVPLEGIRHFAELSAEGWTDPSAAAFASASVSAGVGADVIIPSEENPVAGWTTVPRERPTGSEAERRRNRREAMVLREGGGGVEEADIIRPTFNG